MMRSRLMVGVVALLGTAALGAVAHAETIFLSTQLRPIESAQKFREVVLGDFPDPVQFIPEDTGPFITRIRAEGETGKPAVGVIGGLHGDLPPVQQYLDNLDDVMGQLGDRKLIPSFVELGQYGTGHQVYVPWMQATYVMAANKKALPYLPQGADLDALSYAQLAAWGKAIQDATGERRLGFPGGPKGLIHRFFQGYLYPSYTGGVVRTFKNADAVTMWTEFRELWKTVNPRSTSYDFMQEPLLAGEVWVAFDHTARLWDAVIKQPDDFVLFPAPSAGKGRGYMPVLAGLAIPKGLADRDAAVRLISYLTTPEAQAAVLRETGFYPVTDSALPGDLPEGARMTTVAIQTQANSKDAVPSLLPVGLGDKNGEFNKVFLDIFQRIVIRGQDVKEALETEGTKLAGIMQASGAPCWLPDAASDGPCPVE
ncbi:MAG TPA: ABC transporter substrate-binding protein [Geminicoccaceae bacterium]|nr:ABC transporter substrate-binding protein [Geminicoccus sp.]HMU52823.1 ABC transporter substrate-binding protein [Geminicoccaceae bacterium]